jgi:6-phosphogluconolactonase/glucosamine-6-phosphate isomerase/deaminase
LEVDKTVQNYSNLVEDLTKKSDFTIATFGIGTDGHTAGILPGSPAVDAQQPVFGYVWQDYVRMTITPNWLEGVDKAFVVARGRTKLEALSRLKAAGSSTSEIPSMLLNKIKDVVIYTDIKELL